MHRRLSLLLPLVALGCGAEAPVPDKPTWVDDVQPILKANCFHCHGALAPQERSGTTRWDVPLLPTCTTDMATGMEACTPADSPYLELGFKASQGFKGVGSAGQLGLVLVLAGPEAPPPMRMPPPPALPLSARDLKVLDAWQKNNFALGTHRPNHKPEIAWLDRKAGLFAVNDDNGDQVLGQLDCDGAIVPVNRTGAHKLPSGVSAPCKARLYDGFSDGDVTLDLE